MFEQTSYRSPARHEPMTSFHRWSNLSTLSYNQKCYAFYLWECGCVGTLTTEARQVQRGEEGGEGGQGWGDELWLIHEKAWSFQLPRACGLSPKADSVYEALGQKKETCLPLWQIWFEKLAFPPYALFWNKNQDHVFVIKVLKSMWSSLEWLKTCQHNIRTWVTF